VEDSSISTNY